MTRRDQCYQIVNAVKKEQPTLKGKALRKELNKYYPFCEKKYHPYKIWLDVLKKECGSIKTAINTQLTQRQQQVFNLYNKGLCPYRIAIKINLSVSVIRSHLLMIKNKGYKTNIEKKQRQLF